jgi:hypothetical protein
VRNDIEGLAMTAGIEAAVPAAEQLGPYYDDGDMGIFMPAPLSGGAPVSEEAGSNAR